MVLRRSWRRTAGLAALAMLTVVLMGCLPSDGTGATDSQATVEGLRTFVGDFVREVLQATLL